MRVEDFNYHLPKSLIAQYPSPRREESLLMVLHRNSQTIEHRTFGDISDYLAAEDLLVMNNTRVLPARIVGKKETGGKVEILFIPSWNGTHGEWDVLVKGSGRIKPGSRIEFETNLYGEVKEIKDGKGKIRFNENGKVFELIQQIGHIPLPPYIKRKDEPLDRDRYQTVFAERDGSIAAHTAGLHFTPSLLQSLRDKGVRTQFITLHIGIGTFTPVKVKKAEDHSMESEWVEIKEETARAISETKARHGKVIAVGTTTTRALESSVSEEGGVKPSHKMTSLFIYPPFHFRVIDGLVTNFHLPQSTLIMLASAFTGRDFLLKAYQEAVERKYRFYSYGDAMLIL